MSTKKKMFSTKKNGKTTCLKNMNKVKIYLKILYVWKQGKKPITGFIHPEQVVLVSGLTYFHLGKDVNYLLTPSKKRCCKQ